MSKERYLEACAAVGSEPIEEETPLTIDELPYNCQVAIKVFYHCPDNWDGMSGTYLGKRIECLPFLYNLYEVDYPEEIFTYFKVFEEEYTNYVGTLRKQEAGKNNNGKKS